MSTATLEDPAPKNSMLQVPRIEVPLPNMETPPHQVEATSRGASSQGISTFACHTCNVGLYRPKRFEKLSHSKKA
jgi:hypothetical protein